MPDKAGKSAIRMKDSGFVEKVEKIAGTDLSQAQHDTHKILNPQSPIFSGTCLAFDFGTQRIGIAIGSTLTGSARPLTTIAGEKNEVRFATIASLLKEWQPAALVVGLPCNDDGTPHAMTARCRRFANQLKGRFNLPTILVDERYTSAAASSSLSAQGIHGRKQKSLLDQYAAQQILQAYFDEPAAAKIA